MQHVSKKFCSLTEFFHTSISRSLQNSDMNKKPLSFRSTLRLFTKKITAKSLRVSFPASKFTPIKLIKIRTSPILAKKAINSPTPAIAMRLLININRQMSELPLNERRGNLIQGLQPKSIFLYGCKILAPNDSNH